MLAAMVFGHLRYRESRGSFRREPPFPWGPHLMVESEAGHQNLVPVVSFGFVKFEQSLPRPRSGQGGATGER